MVDWREGIPGGCYDVGAIHSWLTSGGNPISELLTIGRSIQNVHLAMTIRAKCHRIFKYVITTLGQPDNMMAFKVGLSFWVTKRCWGIAEVADTFRELLNSGGDIRITSIACCLRGTGRRPWLCFLGTPQEFCEGMFAG